MRHDDHSSRGARRGTAKLGTLWSSWRMCGTPFGPRLALSWVSSLSDPLLVARCVAVAVPGAVQLGLARRGDWQDERERDVDQRTEAGAEDRAEDEQRSHPCDVQLRICSEASARAATSWPTGSTGSCPTRDRWGRRWPRSPGPIA